ncbi:MAG: T9SS type A sorting domain-containing protein [Crocinitomicaceae bacterium]|nr:T9SS type A sorting domain-containing protein [Crocinitomicaceae bacterium]
MKNRLIIFVFFLISYSGFSQLMRSDVYDFSVGDVFVLRFKYHVTGDNSPGTIDVRHELFRILQSSYLNNSTEVIYQAQRQTYIPPLSNGNGSGTPSVFFIDTVNFSHLNLNKPYEIDDNDSPFGISFITPFTTPYPESCSVRDSLVDNYQDCQNNLLSKFDFGVSFYNDGICNPSETMVSQYSVIEGLGGPYGEWGYADDTGHDPTSNYGGLVLDYYYKNGVHCGLFPDFFLNVDEQNKLQFSVFPNPAKDKLHVQGVEAIQSFVILTADGKLVSQNLTLQGMDIDVSQLSSGFYLLQITNDSGKIGVVRFVK